MVPEKDTFSLSPKQTRAIGAIGAIGAAQSAGSLSRLIGIEVQVEPPELVLADLGELQRIFGDLSAPALGVLIPFTGDIEGNTVLLFPEEGIARLEALLFPEGQASEPMRDSALTEIGNILAGTFLTVLSRLSARIVVSRPPILVRDMAGAIVDGILAEQGLGSTRLLLLLSRLKDTTGRTLVQTVTLPDQGGAALLDEAAKRLISAP